MKLRSVMVYFLLSTLFITSCEDKNDKEEESPIVGNWEVVTYYIDYSDCKDDDLNMMTGRDTIDWNNGEYMTFDIEEDGTLTRVFNMGLGAVSMSGTWTLDGNLFTFILMDDGSPREETVTVDFINNDQIVFTSEVDDCHVSGTKTWSFVLEETPSIN